MDSAKNPLLAWPPVNLPSCGTAGASRPATSSPKGVASMRWGWVPLVCAVWLSACASWWYGEPLGVTIADFTPVEMTLLEQRYAITVRLMNPNDTDIAFDGVAFDLEINGKPFAKGVSNRAGVIPRFGEALVDLRVVSGLQQILGQISQIQKGDQAGFTYRIRGRIHSGSLFGSVPFTATGEFALPAGTGKSGR